jgi:hypothetical protein
MRMHEVRLTPLHALAERRLTEDGPASRRPVVGDTVVGEDLGGRIVVGRVWAITLFGSAANSVTCY